MKFTKNMVRYSNLWLFVDEMSTLTGDVRGDGCFPAGGVTSRDPGAACRWWVMLLLELETTNRQTFVFVQHICQVCSSWQTVQILSIMDFMSIFKTENTQTPGEIGRWMDPPLLRRTMKSSLVLDKMCFPSLD